MPLGMLGKFFHTFALVENARHRGATRIIVVGIMLENGRNGLSVPELVHAVAITSESARAYNADLHNNPVHYRVTMSCLQVGHKLRVPVSQSSISS